MLAEKDNIHPDKIYWFAIYITTFCFLYVSAITFFHIPKENIRFADSCQGFLLGTALTASIGYLLMGTPGKKKETVPPGTTSDTTTLSTTSTTTSSTEPEV